MSLNLGLEGKAAKKPQRSPWVFVPTLYFAAGLPYVLVNIVSVVLYKKMGVDNAQVALWTSFLYLPWVIKMFWGPLIEFNSTKRNWILWMQLALCCCLGCLPFSLQLSNFFWVSFGFFAIAAFLSATHDIAVDGFYLLSLDQEAQAFFVGVRTTFYKIAMIFGSGIIVFLAGKLEVSLDNIPLSWTLAMGLPALVFSIVLIIHWYILPFPTSDTQKILDKPIGTVYLEVIQSYFGQKGIGAVIAFIGLYRLAEAMLVKLTVPFLLDPTEVGGLGLSTADVGLAYGTFGAIALTFGGILGGFLVSHYGVNKSLWPMALVLNLPNVVYVYMAYTHPSTPVIYLLIAVEQFGYGLGTAAYNVYLMYFVEEKYKTSHFAISTGIMALGIMLPGAISGYIQQAVGYQIFFVLAFVLAIPGLLTLLFIPMNSQEKVPVIAD